MNKSQPVSEIRVVASLATLYAFRMLGLFMVFPVMMLYGGDYAGATPVLLGFALGCYGMTQALFQIPLGLLSDVWGRKPIIVLGLLVFAAGSVVAALSDQVWGLIFGRALQGAGAIAGAVLALVGDLTSEQGRTRAMAMIGAAIGLSFSVALVLGPALAATGGLSSIFWLSAVLALLGIAITAFVVPAPVVSDAARAGEHRPVPQLFVAALKNVHLLRLNWGIFALHFVLTATFVAVPIAFLNAGVEATRHWSYYLPVMACAFLAMLPFMIIAERKRRIKAVFVGAVAVLLCAEALFGLASSKWQWVAALFVFFTAFNLLEATLPSLVSKQAPAGSKGTAMGIYSTCQFLGAALGGVVGGYCLSRYGLSSIFIVGFAVCLVWVVLAASMQPPRYLANIVLPQSKEVAGDRLQRNVPGIVEAQWVKEQALLYLKVDEQHFENKTLRDYLDAQA